MVGGANESEGRVEICINNAWGTVCDSGFTKEDARVACRQLGLLQIEGRVDNIYSYSICMSGPLLYKTHTCLSGFPD